MKVANQVLKTLRIKGFSFLYDEYCYYKARKKIVKSYYSAKREKEVGIINDYQYFFKLKKLNNYLFAVESLYAHVSSYI